MSDGLWSWADLVTASGGGADGEPSGDITGFSIDTRSLRTGEVFVALKDQRDGHEFVSPAFAAGAVAAIVSTSHARRAGDGALLRVSDPLTALESIAQAARNRLKPEAKIIAITGSHGKTGTKEMVRVALESVASGAVHASIKSYNNHWGVPLMLANMPANTRYGVFEIGMNHAGEILPLTRLVRPQIAVVVNVLPAHIGNFPDGEIGIAEAKAEIFAGLESAGIAVLPADSPHFERLQARALAAGGDVISFGTSDAADVCCVSCTEDESGSVVRAVLNGNVHTYRLGVPGYHIAQNSLAVVAVLDALGLDVSTALSPLALLTAAAGRGARHTYAAGDGYVLLIDEAYNGNPGSVTAALASLESFVDSRFKRRVAVLGDMLELGEKTEDYHRALAAPARRAADVVYLAGRNMRLLFDELPEHRRGGWAPSAAELLPQVLDAVRPGDVIMVKGSLGSRMSPIVDALKKRFATPGLTV